LYEALALPHGETNDERHDRRPLEKLPLAVKKRLRQSAFDAWSHNPARRSRGLDLTQEERNYIARYVRWYRSLKRVERPAHFSDRDSDMLLFQGKPDPEMPAYIETHPPRRRDGIPPVDNWGYLHRRGFSRPYPHVLFINED
jgi:hypothetical protein